MLCCHLRRHLAAIQDPIPGPATDVAVDLRSFSSAQDYPHSFDFITYDLMVESLSVALSCEGRTTWGHKDSRVILFQGESATSNQNRQSYDSTDLST